MSSLCETTSQTYCNLEIEFLSYQNAKYTTISNLTSLNVVCSIITVSDVLATFVEAFDVNATTIVCGEVVSSNITVYRKQYLFDVFVRVVEKKYGACTGVNIPVWLMRGYDVNPDNINSNGIIDTIMKSDVSLDATNCEIINDSTDNTLTKVKLGECGIKFTTNKPEVCLEAMLRLITTYSQGTDVSLGDSVNISNDGKVIAGGASYYNTRKGAVVIYRLNSQGTSWTQERILSETSWITGNRYGFSIALSGNGNVVAISGSNAKLYVYRYNNGIWGTPTVLNVIPTSIAISDNGNVLAFKASGIASVGVYRYNGSSWGTPVYISPNHISFNLSMSSDGNVIVFGTSINNSNTQYTIVYRYNGTTWNLDTQSDTTLIQNTTGNVYRIYSVVSKDGNTIVSSSNTGVIKIYEYAGSKIWNTKQTITTGLSEYLSSTNIYPVSISPDCKKFVYGVSRTSSTAGRGTVYLYTKDGSGIWTRSNTVYQNTSTEFATSSQGYSVAMSDTTVVSGCTTYTKGTTGNWQSGILLTFCV